MAERRRGAAEGPSWLAIERYALGEATASEVRRIEALAAGDEALRAAIASARRGRALPALPPLPVVSAAARSPRGPGGAGRRSRFEWLRSRWPLAAGALAAACVLLLVVIGGDGGAGGARPGQARIKGGEVSLDLVRERAGSVLEGARSYRDGDRFKVVVSCGGEAGIRGEVVVRQGGEEFRPLAPVELACGNRVVVPGAFRLTGEGAVEVCLVGEVEVCSALASE